MSLKEILSMDVKDIATNIIKMYKTTDFKRAISLEENERKYHDSNNGIIDMLERVGKRLAERDNYTGIDLLAQNAREGISENIATYNKFAIGNRWATLGGAALISSATAAIYSSPLSQIPFSLEAIKYTMLITAPIPMAIPALQLVGKRRAKEQETNTFAKVSKAPDKYNLILHTLGTEVVRKTYGSFNAAKPNNDKEKGFRAAFRTSIRRAKSHLNTSVVARLL